MSKEAMKHLNFAASMAERQLRAGKHFLFEHPFTATAWKEPCLQRLLRRLNILVVKGDQCMYGCLSKGPEGNMHARKSTKFMTSSPFMAARLSRTCGKSHVHVALRGKALAAN